MRVGVRGFAFAYLALSLVIGHYQACPRVSIWYTWASQAEVEYGCLCTPEALSISLAHLAADHAVGEAHDVGVRPGALGPRLHVLQVVREVHRLELVVHKLADVPRQVVVAAKETGIANIST